MTTFRILFTWTLLLFSPSFAFGELIIGFVVSNSATVPGSDFATGVSGIDLTRGSGLGQASGNNNQFHSSGFDGNSLAEAESNNDFVQFGFQSTQEWNLTNLSISYDRTGSGPESIDVQVSVNGGNFQSVFSDNNVAVNGEIAAISLDNFNFTNTSTATFRIFGFQANNDTNGEFAIHNELSIPTDNVSRGIVINGNLALSQIPEPSSFLLFGPCLLMMLRRKRVS